MNNNKFRILKQLELAEEYLDKAIEVEAVECLGSKFRSSLRKAFTQIALAKECLAKCEM